MREKVLGEGGSVCVAIRPVCLMVAPCPGLVGDKKQECGQQMGPGERPLPDSSRAEDSGEAVDLGLGGG